MLMPGVPGMGATLTDPGNVDAITPMAQSSVQRYVTGPKYTGRYTTAPSTLVQPAVAIPSVAYGNCPGCVPMGQASDLLDPWAKAPGESLAVGAGVGLASYWFAKKMGMKKRTSMLLGLGAGLLSPVLAKLVFNP